MMAPPSNIRPRISWVSPRLFEWMYRWVCQSFFDIHHVCRHYTKDREYPIHQLKFAVIKESVHYPTGIFRLFQRSWLTRIKLLDHYFTSPDHDFQVQQVLSRPLNKCISEVVRIGNIIIFHLSKLWKAKFFILCDVVVFLVRMQEKFWSWPLFGVKGLNVYTCPLIREIRGSLWLFSVIMGVLLWYFFLYCVLVGPVEGQVY